MPVAWVAMGLILAIGPFGNGSLACAELREPCWQADGMTVETMGVEYSFGQQMTFRLAVRSEVDITSAHVFFDAGHGPLLKGTALLSRSGAITQASYTHDLLARPLPPFSQVTYGWEIGDAGGARLTTVSQTLDYVDNRFAWRSIAGKGVRVAWYHEDQSLGQATLDAATEIMPRLSQDLAVPFPAQTEIYLYSRVEALQSALATAGRPWQGGQARPELGVVLIALDPTSDARPLASDLAHELTHLLVYQATGDAYTHVPCWLDEGLAVSSEASPDPAYQAALEAAYRDNALISIEALCAPFPADWDTARLSYAQSQSLVRFIREQYGPQGIRTLLAAYRDGAACGSGVERALGLPLARLEMDWQASLGPRVAWQAVFDKVGVWVMLAALLLIAPLPLVFVGRERSYRLD
ncbi:MAG: hypothetical protein JW850_18655 [Thermoflexales bacterium]|nr:hypothetical protein [Thermoflexales bacterium]